MKNSTIVDPSGRYKKTNELITAKNHCVYFNGYDTYSGNMVIWIEFRTNSLEGNTLAKIMDNIECTKSIKHSCIIQILTTWIDQKNHIVYIITESATAKTLFNLVHSPYYTMNTRVISRWFAEIVDALSFLENNSTFHGEIFIDEIYVKTNTGHIKIGIPLHHIAGKTNFKLSYYTPPENLLGLCDAQSDVWMLGIIILETITRKKPYSECKSPSDLMNKLMKNELPKLFYEINDSNAKDFLSQCFLPHAIRPMPSDLARHPFLQMPKRRESSIIESPSFITQSKDRNVFFYDILAEPNRQIRDTDSIHFSTSLPGILMPTLKH
ncbi:hypothetical protein TRFO_17314 [Tritrichomonas foetus]|uniref:Protein kinase domain-containing protein n=1 Tax=Tritrichomonas foetus TaxID=1144522 RepID=A0A1J4KSX8_9EUKA|nr:hypothetical protein TRFO_17314 [Tritrichomonas foetus]|eukprot:OHT12766.1 hypothetical protein TRFO_17314 [Tritrichomonas foetus]